MRRDIRMVRGSTETLSGIARRKDGSVIPLTGATLVWRFGENETAGSVTPSVVSAALGSWLLTIAPADTASDEPGFYRHQGEVTEASGVVTQFLWGDFVLERDLS